MMHRPYRHHLPTQDHFCGGYNIAGPEVENVLLEHDAVIEAAVVASPDPLRGAVPKAFIVLKDGIAPSRRSSPRYRSREARARAV